MTKQNLALVLQVLKLSQTELARAVGLSPRAVRFLVAGRSPSIETAAGIVSVIEKRFLGATLKPGSPRRRYLNGDPNQDAIVKGFLEAPWGFKRGAIPGAAGRPEDPDPSPRGGLPRPDQETPHARHSLPQSTSAARHDPRRSPPAGEAPQSSTPPALAPDDPLPPPPRLPVLRAPPLPPPDLADLSAAVRVYNGLNGQAALRSLYDAIRAQAPTWLGAADSNGAIRARLRRAGATPKRSRAPRADLAARNEDIAAIVGPPLFKLARDYGKGAEGKSIDAFQKFAARGDVLPSILAAPDIRAELLNACGGVMPSNSIVRRAVRQFFGSASRAEDAETHLILQTLGVEAQYAGQVVAVDAFGLPVTFEHDAWGLRGEERPSGEQYFKRWVYALTDMESGYCLLYSAGGRSESDNWPAAMISFLLALGFAPSACICDQTARLFASLRHMQIGKPAPVRPEVLAWLAAGCRGFTHEGKRPTAKGFIESTVRILRSAWRGLDSARTLARHTRIRSGEELPAGARAAAWYLDEADFQQLVPAWKDAANARELLRAARPRAELWTGHQASLDWQKGRLLSPAFASSYKEHVARHRVMQSHGRLLVGTLDGHRLTLELDKDCAFESSAEDAPALVIPAGLCAGDDPETVRVYVLRNGPVPKLLPAQAHAGRNFFGRVEGLKAKFGEEYKAKPWTAEDRARFNRDAAAKVYAAGLREGTTGQPIAPASPEDCYRPE